MRRALLLLPAKLLPALLAALLASCAAPLAPPAPLLAPALAPVAYDAAWYERAARAGKAVFAVDPAASLITITVRRSGALARFGHDHVVAVRTLAGYVAPEDNRADFQFRLDQMTVDESALRTAEGLDTLPSADAIHDTRNNMLTRVLDAERFPLVSLHAERIPGVAGMLRVAISLHGITRSYPVQVSMAQGGAALAVSGSLELLQTDFGIAPMSIMGGALTVQDRMMLRFHIVARKR